MPRIQSDHAAGRKHDPELAAQICEMHAVATDEQLARIARVPKPEFMGRGINQHTLEKICKKKGVGASILAKVSTILQQRESEQ